MGATLEEQQPRDHNIRFPLGMWERLRDRAAAERRSFNAQIVRYCEEGLRRDEQASLTAVIEAVRALSLEEQQQVLAALAEGGADG